MSSGLARHFLRLTYGHMAAVSPSELHKNCQFAWLTNDELKALPGGLIKTDCKETTSSLITESKEPFTSAAKIGCHRFFQHTAAGLEEPPCFATTMNPKSKKKGGILLVANYSNTTGYAWRNIYNLFSTIASHFTREGFEIHICFAQITPPIEQFAPSPTISFHEYDIKNKSFHNTRKLIKLLTAHDIRFVYLTDQPAFDIRYLLMRAAGIHRIVVHQRISVPDPSPAKYQGGLKGFVKSILGRWDAINADRIFAVSDFVRNRLLLKNRLPARRVIKILNGINLDRFKPGETVSNDNVSGSVTIFVCGRATQYKGIQVLIEAARLLDRNSTPNFEIRYAGDGPDMPLFKDLVAKYDLQAHFVFLGETSGTADEVCRADIIVVPSIWGDACPSSVSEALASGKAVIATAVGGVPEIVGNQDNALLVAPNDPVGLKLALDRLMRSPTLRNRIGRNARQRAEAALDEIKYHSLVISCLRNEFRIQEE